MKMFYADLQIGTTDLYKIGARYQCRWNLSIFGADSVLSNFCLWPIFIPCREGRFFYPHFTYFLIRTLSVSCIEWIQRF